MKYIKEGTEFLDQLKDSVHDLYDENKELKKEIERLKEMKLHTEKYASEMEDKYILEKNKNVKAIEHINKTKWLNYNKCAIKKLLEILKEVDKE